MFQKRASDPDQEKNACMQENKRLLAENVDLKIEIAQLRKRLELYESLTQETEVRKD